MGTAGVMPSPPEISLKRRRRELISAPDTPQALANFSPRYAAGVGQFQPQIRRRRWPISAPDTPKALANFSPDTPQAVAHFSPRYAAGVGQFQPQIRRRRWPISAQGSNVVRTLGTVRTRCVEP